VARLTFENVSKQFPGVLAVDGVSLDVADGEFIVLVGPSGSGKSTLLRLVAGLEALSGGAIRFDGQRIDALPPRRRDVAMAFQTPALYPHLSVRENLAFPLRMRKSSATDIGKRVAATAEPLRIAALLDRRPGELSGGERQRVALGRALVRDARCLLLDEPFAHLDGPLREQVRLDLLEIHRRRPTTTLCVTHDQHDALLLGHRVAVLAAGRLQQVGPPLEIYDRPANRFVAGFFGAPPMHFLDGRLEAKNENLHFVAGAIRLRVPDSIAAKLKSRVDAPIVLGLRPEAIRLADANEANGQSITATVRISEVLGDRVFHRIETSDGQSLIVQGARHAPILSEGQRTFHADPSGMNFFAPGPFGERI
jgi:ABC-type sugar transport system ATPase subunit